MLFSEPKIPQLTASRKTTRLNTSFSALQRAENSSIAPRGRLGAGGARFQCSSASRKFLNSDPRKERADKRHVSVLFSEPKIPQFETPVGVAVRCSFQCSSASRKFLNSGTRQRAGLLITGFSALQRAENSSIPRRRRVRRAPRSVSVLFSEPKIPQFTLGRWWGNYDFAFQCSSASRKFLNPAGYDPRTFQFPRFSALQRAENSSIPTPGGAPGWPHPFQCSSASRKFLNVGWRSSSRASSRVSVLFSEPKIPQALMFGKY